MQELLDITYKSISNAKELKLNGLNDQREIDILLNLYNVYRVIIERDMLKKEKEQIIEAYGTAIIMFYESEQPEEYYNKTYSQNN